MTYRAATKDMVSDAELSVLKTMSKAVGVDMVLYQSEEQNGEYQGANGFYRNGTVYLDVHAGATKTTEQSAILLTAAHELTHYLRENNAEAYTELQDFVMQHLIESGTDIETLAKKKVAKERGLISMEDAAEEVIADSCEMMLENTQVPQMMAKENPGLFAQIREWLAEFAAKLRRAFEGVQAQSAEAQAMMQYAEELQQIWDNALAGAAQNVRNNTQTEADNGTNTANNGTDTANNGTDAANNETDAANNETPSGRGKASLREFEDGTKYVDVQTQQSLFDNLTLEEMQSKAKEIIRQRFSGKVIGVSNTAFVNGQTANEYAYPSKFIKDDQLKEAKMRTAPELDNLIEAGRNYRTSADGMHGHTHKNAVGGFTYFDAIFKVGNEYFEGVINIENNRNGRRFKDVTKIRNVTEDIISSYGKNPKSKFLSDTSINSISRNTENDNTKFSQRERDEDLQKKYPKLNLNEDISELDGVPAVELTDGSVLPILDRDRYPTHVSFIEGNRIDVDDLRSGGWIGDGVYDPCGGCLNLRIFYAYISNFNC